MKDIAVPYFRRTIAAMRAANPNSCKPFKVQICILIVDVWWGWLCSEFRDWLRHDYPWIKLLYVPARCTPKAQPMDAGVIAKIKGYLRNRYGKWACDATIAQLGEDVAAADVKIPSDVPTCKRNLFEWLSASVDHFNQNAKNGIVHCWEQTTLLTAWESSKQMEAMLKARELFPNLETTSDVTAAVASKISIDLMDLRG